MLSPTSLSMKAFKWFLVTLSKLLLTYAKCSPALCLLDLLFFNYMFYWKYFSKTWSFSKDYTLYLWSDWAPLTATFTHVMQYYCPKVDFLHNSLAISNMVWIKVIMKLFFSAFSQGPSYDTIIYSTHPLIRTVTE